MVATSHSVRLRVDLHSKTPIIFSYPDLLKRHEKTVKEAPKAAMLLDDEQDPFYKALLDRAAKYDMNPGGEDVESGEEDNQLNKDTKGDEYDYEDPFIDDSEMMLDDSYEYSQPEFDGFFVYHGALDGSDNVSGTKKKSNTKKEKPTATTGKAKASTSTSARKSSHKSDAIELSDTEENHQTNKPTTSTSSNTKTKKSSSAQKSDTIKGGPTMKKSTSSTTTAAADATTATSTTTKKASSVKTNKGGGAASTSASNKTPANGTSTNATVSSSAKAVPTSSTSSSSTTTTSSSSTTNSDGNKKHSKMASNKLQPLHPTLEPLMEKIRVDRAKESFEIKSKFPASLRPTVLEMAIKMFKLYHKVDENVINHLMAILPYNRFTMKKFLTTKSGPGIVNEYQQEIERLIQVLKTAVDEAMPEHLQQYEQKLLEQQNQATDGPDVEKKFRCNETIRRTLYDILTLDMHSVNLSNEIAEFSGRNDLIESETKARKAMYAKLLPCWPTGWMTTYDISRQYSTYKAKMKNTDETSVKLGGLSSPSVSSTGMASSSSNMSSSGAKRSTITPVKRSAPSTTSANTYNGAQGNGGSEKRKKVAVNEAPSDSESNRQASQESTANSDIKVEPDDVSVKESSISSSIVENNNNNTSSPSSHKPSSMNIASLISGP